MHAIIAAAPGGPETLKWEQLETPSPGDAELLVRVEAAGVNFIDTYQRSGAYKVPLPMRLGLEGAGVVEAVGPGVSGVSPGQRVAWAAAPGSYATHVLVKADKAVPVPDGVGADVAAAAMLQGMTAHYLAHDTASLSPGRACLVQAAAGGVGLLLCQMAKAKGALVIGTASSEEKAALARQAGADHVVIYTREDFVAEARRLTGGAGVDVVFDSVGKDTFAKSLDALRPRGLLALFGQSSGAVAPFDPQILSQKGSLFLTRPTLAHYTLTRDELLARAGAVLAMIAGGALSIRVGLRLPLRDAAEAHRALEGRRTTGKVLLLP